MKYVDRDEPSGGLLFNVPPVTGGSMAHGYMVNEIEALTIGEMIFPHLPHVLTAERSAVQLFGRELSIRRTELVDTLLARSARAGKADDTLSLLGQRARRYSMPIRDSLRIVDDLAVLKKLTSPLASLADRLGQDVMQGAIQITEDGEMGYHPEGGSSGMSMSLASSSVKALSSLSFYLRHLAQVGDFLIIDEPELNLHSPQFPVNLRPKGSMRPGKIQYPRTYDKLSTMNVYEIPPGGEIHLESFF